MKYTFLAVAALAAFLGTVNADSVSCSVIDYLYYSSDCCDNSNAVQCMESIPQTDKAAIDNLASLKRSDGSACQSGDSVKFLSNIGTGSSGIVCADEDACVIPCLNGGTISGTISGDDCLCTCATGFSGGDCGTVIPCPTVCQNNGTVNGTVADGDCGCDCSATGGYTGDNCENAPAGPPPSYVILSDGTTKPTDIVDRLLSGTECQQYATDNSLTYTAVGHNTYGCTVKDGAVNFDSRTTGNSEACGDAVYQAPCVLKPAPAATHKLDDGSAGYADAAAFLAANTLIADSAACLALADDIKASVRLITGQETYEYYEVTQGSAMSIQAIDLASIYPKGCSVRLGGGTSNRLYYNDHATGAKPSANNIAVVAP